MKNTEFQARTESYWVNDEITEQFISFISFKLRILPFDKGEVTSPNLMALRLQHRLRPQTNESTD